MKKDKTRISILADNPLTTELLSWALSKYGWSVDSYSSFDELFNNIDYINDRCDAIILDVQSSGTHGLKSVRELLDRVLEIPIILTVEAINKELAVSGLNMGVKGIVTKDMTVKQLQSVLRFVLEGENYISPSISRSKSSVPFNLTEAEDEIFKLLGEGYCNKTISQISGFSENTVKSYMVEIFKKLGVDNRTRAALLSRSRNKLMDGRFEAA